MNGKPEPLRVLLVEDTDDEIQLAKLAFSRLGFRTLLEVLETGGAAVQRLLEERQSLPDLVLLDLNLPLLSGVEVLRRVRQRHPKGTLRIVIYTTSANQADREACLAEGCDDYVVKPTGFGDAVRLLESLLSPVGSPAHRTSLKA